jgi:hypothetical protein
MRMTITLDEGTAAVARRYAEDYELTLSEAIALLIRRGMRKAPRIKYADGLPVFDLPESGRPITSQQVKAFEVGPC